MDFAALKIDEGSGEVRFAVHARPRSRREGALGVREGALDVAVRAAPEKGAANDDLVRLLAELLGVPRRAVRLIRGESSRSKAVAVLGVTAAEVRARLAGAG